MADELLGEVEVTLGDRTFTLKATLQAIRTVENMRKTGWQSIINRAYQGNLYFDDMAAIIWSCVIGAGKEDEPPNYETVAQMLMDHGWLSCIEAVQQLMLISTAGVKTLAEADVGNSGGGTSGPEGSPAETPRKRRESTGGG